jgi:hypothetical protein
MRDELELWLWLAYVLSALVVGGWLGLLLVI